MENVRETRLGTNQCNPQLRARKGQLTSSSYGAYMSDQYATPLSCRESLPYDNTRFLIATSLEWKGENTDHMPCHLVL